MGHETAVSPDGGRVMKKLGLVLIVSAMAFSFVPPAAAQSNCLPFMAIAQAELLNPVYLRPGDLWGGPIEATLGDEILVGIFSENDGTPFKNPYPPPPFEPTPGVVGIGRGGTGIYKFSDDDSFTVKVGTAVWPYPPSKNGFGHWRGNAKITGGTGRFANATGHVSGDGPFVVWVEMVAIEGVPTPVPAGRWNPTMNGVICLP
jgi:hypothetical protein